MEGQKVTIGRIVRFVDMAGEIHPAIVVRVYKDSDKQLVNLQVFCDSSEHSKWECSVRYEQLQAMKPMQANSWHWPPRE